MTRTFLFAAAVLFASTGLGLAQGLVPGSDTGTRDQQSMADRSVLADRTTDTGANYGYVVRRNIAATSAPAVPAPAPAVVPTTSPRGTLVPGSDSF